MAFWSLIESEESLRDLLNSSSDTPLFILKHSYRCALSSMAKSRIEKSEDSRFSYYLIDVVKNRSVSNLLSEIFTVQHESPQAYIIIGSKLVEVKSHLAIQPKGFSTLLDSFSN
jgi:bacillithiol system protein YtxJ